MRIATNGCSQKFHIPRYLLIYEQKFLKFRKCPISGGCNVFENAVFSCVITIQNHELEESDMNNIPCIQWQHVLKNYIVKDVLYRTQEILFNKEIFFPKKQNSKTTIMSFPCIATNQQVRCVQKQNYEYFIYTMAEILQKYAPEILE